MTKLKTEYFIYPLPENIRKFIKRKDIKKITTKQIIDEKLENKLVTVVVWEDKKNEL